MESICLVGYLEGADIGINLCVLALLEETTEPKYWARTLNVSKFLCWVSLLTQLLHRQLSLDSTAEVKPRNCH